MAPLEPLRHRARWSDERHAPRQGVQAVVSLDRPERPSDRVVWSTGAPAATPAAAVLQLPAPVRAGRRPLPRLSACSWRCPWGYRPQVRVSAAWPARGAEKARVRAAAASDAAPL